MRSLSEIGAQLEGSALNDVAGSGSTGDLASSGASGSVPSSLEGAAAAEAAELLGLGEEILEHWLRAHDVEPTDDKKEGFRVIALHRQGAKLDPTFNACRETCRELAFHYNIVSMDSGHKETDKRLVLMRHVAKHLYYFVGGKLENAKLGEFCCASKPVRLADAS